MLGEAATLQYVGEASSAEEALDLLTSLRPEVVLLDVEMPGTDGAHTAVRLLERDPNLTIVAWTVSDQSDDLLRMVNAGCHGYVLKDVGPEELHRAISSAIRRESPVPRRMLPDVLRLAARQVPTSGQIDATLTDRETATLRLMVKGLPSKRMASELGIARSSVETHIRNLYRKLDVNSRSEAISTALKLGLISLSDL